MNTKFSSVDTNELVDLRAHNPTDLDRRNAVFKAGKAGSQMLVASLPFGLAAGCASTTGKLVAKDPKRAADVLDFALLLVPRDAMWRCSIICAG